MKNKGFTLVEMIFSLWTVSFSILLISSAMSLLVGHNFKLYQSEDQAFLHQMRLIYALSMDVKMEGDMLAFRYKQQDMHYEQYENKLILQVGYQVFLNDIEEVHFERKEDCYYLIYHRKDEKIQRHIIGCE